MSDELREHYELIFSEYLDALDRLIQAKARYIESGGRAIDILAAYDEFIGHIVSGARVLRTILEQEPIN